jgi:GST-like protein
MKLYFHATPNSMKVAVLLQELAVPFELIPIDIFKGEQHAASFLAINPNGKVPALVDGEVTVFDSHAILIYLAEKHGRFLPAGGSARAAVISWLQLIATGLSPFSGQAVHFLHYAPEPNPYATNRYVREVERHYRIIDARLAASTFLAGEDYSIADMALWGWAASAGYIFGEKGLADYPHLARFMSEMAGRETVKQALEIKQGLTFKSELDAEAMRAMFPSVAAAA